MEYGLGLWNSVVDSLVTEESIHTALEDEMIHDAQDDDEEMEEDVGGSPEKISEEQSEVNREEEVTTTIPALMIEERSCAKEVMSEVYNLRKFGGCYCDLYIKVQEKTFAAHQIIMAGFSPYFRTRMETHMELSGLNAETFDIVLEYAYSGGISINAANAEQVLRTACFLEVPHLANICAEYLGKTIDSINFVKMYRLASDLACSVLVEAANKFVLTNFTNVCKLDKFLEMELGMLVDALKSDDLEVSNEEVVLNAVMRWVNHEKKRVAVLPEVFKFVRMAYISAEDINRYIREEKAIKDSALCMYWCTQVLVHKFQPDCGTDLMPAFTQPRQTTSGVTEITPATTSPILKSAPATVCTPGTTPAPVPIPGTMPAPVPIHGTTPAPVPIPGTMPAPVPLPGTSPAPVPIPGTTPAPVPISVTIPSPKANPTDAEDEEASSDDSIYGKVTPIRGLDDELESPVVLLRDVVGNRENGDSSLVNGTPNSVQKSSDRTNKRVSLKQQVFTCPVCDKNLASEKSLKRHHKNLHEETTFQCKYCDKKFGLKESVNRHLKSCSKRSLNNSSDSESENSPDASSSARSVRTRKSSSVRSEKKS